MRLGILTGGGDCPGLNAVIRSAVRSGTLLHGHEFVGYRNGWRGVLEGDDYPLPVEAVRGILHRGGTLVGGRSRNRRDRQGRDRQGRDRQRRDRGDGDRPVCNVLWLNPCVRIPEAALAIHVVAVRGPGHHAKGPIPGVLVTAGWRRVGLDRRGGLGGASPPDGRRRRRDDDVEANQGSRFVAALRHERALLASVLSWFERRCSTRVRMLELLIEGSAISPPRSMPRRDGSHLAATGQRHPTREAGTRPRGYAVRTAAPRSPTRRPQSRTTSATTGRWSDASRAPLATRTSRRAT